MILQPESNAQSALQCSERLRKTVADNSMYYGKSEIKVTISLGVAIYRSGEKVEECIQRADKSLYVAKAAGRNRTGPL